MFTSKPLQILLMIVGIGYGVILIQAAFINSKLAEMFRIDTFFTPHPTKNTRKLNLIFGVFVVGSSLYSLFRLFR